MKNFLFFIYTVSVFCSPDFLYNRVVLIGVYDSGFNSSTNEWNEAAYNAMEKLGAQKIRRLGFRDSYALVTVSGSPHNTIELHKKYVERTSTSAECGIGTRIRPQAKVQYRYNVAGQRIYKQVDSNPAEHYILDEDKILGVFRGAGLLYWNIYGNDGVSGRLEVSIPQEEEAGESGGEGAGGGEVGGTQKLFYLKDHLGSTRAVINTNGALVESYDYYPFGLKMPGRIYPVTPTITKNLFTGKELDGETGWYDLGARPYIPALGRMPVVDPLWDKYPSLSPYTYAANNPVVVYDPDGRYLETLIDLVSLGVSIYDVARDPGSTSNWIGLGLDVVSVLAPGAAALGTIYKAADKGVEAAKALEKVGDTASDLQKAAQTAAEKVGQGEGAVHGTKVHTEFSKEVEKLGGELKPEISYKGGAVVPRGTKGSIRVDVVQGTPEKPTAIYDLKTGGAKLTEKRIQEIREHLPPEHKDIPIKEIREKNQ